MGADNLAEFHRWERWDEIMRAVPVGVIARPGERDLGAQLAAARRFRARGCPAAAACWAGAGPGWCFVNVPMVDSSSTAIRARANWRLGGRAPAPCQPSVAIPETNSSASPASASGSGQRAEDQPAPMAVARDRVGYRRRTPAAGRGCPS